ncbi:helix-turn-helix domain-containing protein [Streptomyces sp. I05A-00742]|uniref:helix-turn-helix domain-containing protein n=1 Tax=Streptomyces sp. I05A-00742 TaxID=2732853 RepID=UPI001487DE33|nr:helix-turn-helix domain-containing protein [Streptomyces sp. I05A-00742]
MPSEEHDGGESPLAKLRDKLSDGLARKRLTKTQLANQSGLGRTTIQEAFRVDGAVPSAETVVALARVLGVSEAELLDLRRRAAAHSIGSVPGHGEGPGRPIGQWDPHDLEVHPSGSAAAASSVRALSGYVRRAHDQVLAEAVSEVMEGRSRMLVLVGSSSTGKTRACWEAVQPLADEGWQLWHPYDPTRAEATLAELERVVPLTVVWLNEAQHYLGHPQVGERIAAALHTLLTDPSRGPILVLGTLWPEYEGQYNAMPRPGSPDPHSRARELLAGRTVTVPDTFNQDALRTATILAQDGDRLLSDALSRAGTHGRVAQDLAGAPELLRRYEHGAPAVRALLETAMDARRLGVGLHLPQAFVTDAAADYLTDDDWDRLTNDWAEAAYADLARPVHGKQVPLGRTNPRPSRRPPIDPTPASAAPPPTGPMLRLADYLEQHGRSTRRLLCPPASFWHAAHTHLTHPGDLNNLAQAAESMGRSQWAHHLRLRAAGAGHPDALIKVAWVRERVGDPEGAESLFRQAANAGDPRGLKFLSYGPETARDWEGAAAYYRRAADAGDPDAIRGLARLRERVGDLDGAEVLYRQAADAGDPNSLSDLMMMRERAGDREDAEAIAREATDAGDTLCFEILAEMRDEAGDWESAEAIAREAANAGNILPLLQLWRSRLDGGDLEGAESAFRQAAEANGGPTPAHLARMREQAGDREGAESLALKAADAGDFYILRDLERMRNEAGDEKGLDALYRHAADAGHIRSLLGHRRWQYGLDPDGSPSSPWISE